MNHDLFCQDRQAGNLVSKHTQNGERQDPCDHHPEPVVVEDDVVIGQTEFGQFWPFRNTTALEKCSILNFIL